MATKISNLHAKILIEDHDNHKLIDVYINLARLSSEVKVNGIKKFIIYSPNSSKYQLSKTILNIAPSVKSLSTVYKSFNVLIDKGMLAYNEKFLGWEIVGMEKMFSSGGYMELRELFFTPLFDALTYLEKKTLFYMVYIMSLKNYKNINKIMVNILDKKGEWRKIYKTSNIYYIREQVKSVIEKFFVTVDEYIYGLERLNESSRKRALKRYYFRFTAVPAKSIKTTLSKPKTTPKERIESFRDKDSSFYGFLKKLPIYEAWTEKYLNDYLKEQLLRQCAALHPRAKQDITLQILKQMDKGTVVSSIPNYISKTIQTYLERSNSYV